MMNKIMKRIRGAGLTETIIVTGLVAVGSLGVVMIFGDDMRGLFSAAGNAMAGDEHTTPATRPADAELHKNLNTFAQNAPGARRASMGNGGAAAAPGGQLAATSQALKNPIASLPKGGPAHLASQMPRSAANPWLDPAHFQKVGLSDFANQRRMLESAGIHQPKADPAANSVGEGEQAVRKLFQESADALSGVEPADPVEAPPATAPGGFGGTGEIELTDDFINALISGEVQWDVTWDQVKTGQVPLSAESVEALRMVFMAHVWEHDDVATLEQQLAMNSQYPEETKQILKEKLDASRRRREKERLLLQEMQSYIKFHTH